MNTKIITLLAILAMYFNSAVAQQVYNTPSMSYQGGRQVSTFDNDKLTLSVSGYMDKVSYNGKEYKNK